MTATTDPSDGWDVCSVAGCPLEDPDAPEPDNIDEIRETGIAHGVKHVDISDHWWINTRPDLIANDNSKVLAAAAWLAHHEGRDYCIRSTEYAGEWNGYQLLACDLLHAVDAVGTPAVVPQPGDPDTRAAALTEASDVARKIARRCEDKARTKTGDDRKHWTAMSAGARMVALKLIEMADEAGRPTG